MEKAKTKWGKMKEQSGKEEKRETNGKHKIIPMKLNNRCRMICHCKLDDTTML